MRAFLTLACLAVTATATPWHQLDGYTFDHYVREHGKAYASSDEHAARHARYLYWRPNQ